MKLKKVVLATACAAVLVVGSVAGTMAYLTSQDEVTNTFTVGNVAITLDEKNVDNDVYEGKTPERDKANDYKLIPGTTYVKDPIVHVDANSEDCWLFVKVVNEISAIEGGTTVAEQMTANGWAAVEGQQGIYAYEKTVSAGADVPVFGSFTIADTIANETLGTYAGKTIVVTAYAVQADSFATAAAALAAAPFPAE